MILLDDLGEFHILNSLPPTSTQVLVMSEANFIASQSKTPIWCLQWVSNTEIISCGSGPDINIHSQQEDGLFQLSSNQIEKLGAPCIFLSSDKSKYAYCTLSGNFFIRDRQNHSELYSHKFPPGKVWSIHWNPVNDKEILVCGNGLYLSILKFQSEWSVEQISIPSNQQFTTPQSQFLTYARFSPCGKFISVASAQGYLFLYNHSDKATTSVATIRAFTNPIRRVEFSPCSKYIVCVGDDLPTAAKIFSTSKLAPGIHLRSSMHRTMIHGLAVHTSSTVSITSLSSSTTAKSATISLSSDSNSLPSQKDQLLETGRIVFATGCFGGIVLLWSSHSSEPLMSYKVGKPITYMSFNPQGNVLAVALDDGSISMIQI